MFSLSPLPDTRCELNTIDLAKRIINALDEKKAENIILLDIKDVSSFTDCFIICSGSSSRMLESLSSSVMNVCESKKIKSITKDGHAEAGWIVLDIGDIVVHIFNEEQRAYYDLEELWSNGKFLLHLN